MCARTIVTVYLLILFGLIGFKNLYLNCDALTVKNYSLMLMFIPSVLRSIGIRMRSPKIWLLLSLVILLHTVSWADEVESSNCPKKQTVRLRVHDEVWLLSCRSLGCPPREHHIPVEELTEGLVTWQYNFNSQHWGESNFKNVFLGSKNLKTIIWVHGNLTTANEALSTGLTVYKNLIRGDKNQPPVRFIIWSWPASKILKRPVPDARLKAARTTSAGLRLAGLLRQIPEDPSVSLIGFSFGAQVVSAALELLAGGELNQTSIRRQAVPQLYRVTLFAAALDSSWLLPDRRFGNALDVTDRLTLINNHCDWVLKHYGKIYCHCGRRGPTALGYTGLPLASLATEQKEKIKQFNVSSSLGKEHALKAYLHSWSAMQRIREGVFQSSVRSENISEHSLASHSE